MNDKIMARLRGGTASYRILFDGEELPDLGLEIPIGIEYAKAYDPQAGPEVDYDLYYVELDKEQIEKMVDPYIDALNVGVERVTQPEYDGVNAVYKLSGRKIIISRVNSSARVGENGKTLLSFGESGVSAEKVSFAIDFSGVVDAYYDGVNRIYFSQFSKAKGLFKDFNEFYEEAWFDQKQAFLDTPLFDVGQIDADDFSPAETKVIAELHENHRLDLENEEVVEKTREYVKKYPLSGVILNNDGKIKITTKDDLKCTIKLLTQRYYVSEITGEVMEARGSTKMKNQKAKKVVNGQEVMAADDK